MTAAPPRPPLEGLRRQLAKSRAQNSAKKSRLPRDGFIRETFTLPRQAAREKAREWFDTFPKSAYWTEIESWCERPDDVIEFTMRRLPTAD
ncbi:MAG: hypothetical protein NBV76_01345 [Candidatus Ochrobactrum gambitense]|nr:MAG: hypothetical protein NBV76_01345 [Candidatus Ochrobactrum gambitense]WEK15749.1 MAG: hypothetical protein P0Y54_09615 [Candidatus Ochrobactrum gambitense]